MELLRRQLKDPSWNASFEPYWKSVPAVGTLYSKEVFEKRELRELLQNDYLVWERPSLCLVLHCQHLWMDHDYLSKFEAGHLLGCFWPI